MDIHLSGGKCEPVRGLLLEAEKVNRLLRENPDMIEPMFAQLLQCVKHYEVVTYQAALLSAQNLDEKRIVSALTEILEEENRLYLQLQNFITITNSRQKTKLNTSVKAG